jgi:hypothetical protein
MNLCPTRIEILNALYHGAQTRSEIAKFNNRKEGSTCARVDELSYYIKADGKKYDPITKLEVGRLMLNKRGIKAVQSWLTSSDA